MHNKMINERNTSIAAWLESTDLGKRKSVIVLHMQSRRIHEFASKTI